MTSRQPFASNFPRLAAASALALGLLEAPISRSFAQQAGPDSADPAEIRRRFEERALPEEPEDPDLDVIPGPEPAPPEEDALLSFVLSAVSIDGATVFDPVEFGPAYTDYLTRSVTSDDVEIILSRITEMYRERGYFLSRAIALPQDVDSGMLRINVVEGFIETVKLAGDVPDPDLIRSYTDRIVAQRPLTLGLFERTLFLINDLAGLSVGVSLDATDGSSGAYELTLKITYDAVDGSAYMDNRGTRAVGRYQTWLSGGVNSIFGTGERFQLGLFTVPNQPKELIYLDVRYEQPIGRNGTYVSLAGSRSDSDAGGRLKALDTESESYSGTVRVGHPVIRTRRQNLWLVGSFGYLESREERDGAIRFEDRTRVARLRTTYSLADTLSGTTRFSFEASKGLEIFGASRRGAANLSRSTGRSDFFKVTSDVSRVQELVGGFTLALAARAQKSSVPLLSSEEFGVGGSRYGRGYDSSEITGDDGAAGLAELRFDAEINETYLKSVQVYGFYDVGAVWNTLPGGKSARESLASVGGGVRLTVTSSVFATIEVAKPLTRTVANEGDDDARAFFSFAARF